MNCGANVDIFLETPSAINTIRYIQQNDKVYMMIKKLIFRKCSFNGVNYDEWICDKKSLLYCNIDEVSDILTISRALCITTLLQDNFVYINADSTIELVQQALHEEI